MRLGRGGVVRGINRTLQRFGECWSLGLLDALKHNLVALHELIYVDLQVPHGGVPGQLRDQATREGVTPPAAWKP